MESPCLHVIKVVAAVLLNAAEVKSGALLSASNSHVELLVLAPVGVAHSKLAIVDAAITQETLLSIDIHQHVIDVLVSDILVVIIAIISLFDSLWGRADLGIVASLHAWGTASG